eukprot:5975933-Lingulodinium_polyedra.AAC.1
MEATLGAPDPDAAVPVATATAPPQPGALSGQDPLLEVVDGDHGDPMEEARPSDVVGLAPVDTL